MEYMPTRLFHVWGFIYSAGLGFCLGLVYDFFRIMFFILTGSDKKLACLRDIIYVSVLMWANFIFMLTVYSGRVMFFAFAGEIAGFAVYFSSVGNLLYRPLKGLLRTIREKFCLIFNRIARGLSFLSNFIIKKLKFLSFF